jgi:hypothetical protein
MQMFPMGAGKDPETLRRHTLKTGAALKDRGVTQSPMLDWFHIAMRLNHLERVAGVLSADDAGRTAAKAVIVNEVERLCWRLWNGKATNARIIIDRIRVVL